MGIPRQSSLKVAILADPVWDALQAPASGRGDGQAATWLPQLARAFMEDAGLSIRWLSLSRQRPSLRAHTMGNIEFVEIPAWPVTVDVLTGYRMARARILRSFHDFAPDVVHAWGTERAYPAVLGSVKQPGLLSMNGVLGELHRRGVLPEGWRWQRQCNLETKWLARADLVVTESRWASEAVRSLQPSATVMETVYGVHPSFYQLHWTPDASDPVLLFAGTLVPGKGVDRLVEAMNLLQGSPWRLEIAGDGPLADNLKAVSSPKIQWLGNLGWQELQRKLSRAWCLVHPTLADSNPNIVKEARVIGLPVITTIHGGQAEYLVEGGNAAILSDVSAEALATAITRMMEGGLSVIQSHGKHGHAEDRERFLTKHTAESFRGHYQRLVHPSRE